MNGFLVFASCQIDDIPLGLFATRHVAEEFGRSRTEQDVIRQARQMGRDTSIVFCIDLMAFTDGKPALPEIVLDFAGTGLAEG